MTTDSTAPATATVEEVPSMIAELVRTNYPQDLAVLGIPVCCCSQTGDIWAVPVRLNCGTYKVAFCRLEATTAQLVSPSEPAATALLESQRLPSLQMEEGTLEIVVHTPHGDRCFSF